MATYWEVKQAVIAVLDRRAGAGLKIAINYVPNGAKTYRRSTALSGKNGIGITPPKLATMAGSINRKLAPIVGEEWRNLGSVHMAACAQIGDVLTMAFIASNVTVPEGEIT